MISKSQRESLRNKLLERQRHLLKGVKDVEETLLFLDQSRPIELSEEAQEESASLSLAALDNQARKELREIVRTLAKLDRGGFGICESCQKSIARERLLAVPTVRFCIKCQKKFEGGAQEQFS